LVFEAQEVIDGYNKLPFREKTCQADQSASKELVKII